MLLHLECCRVAAGSYMPYGAEGTGQRSPCTYDAYWNSTVLEVTLLASPSSGRWQCFAKM
jgi:hypothetical protein